MNFLFKMPLKSSKVAKFFNNVGNNILRDFYEIIMISNKRGFARRTIQDFNDQKEKFFPEEMVFLDGVENLEKGLGLFTLTYIEEEQMVIYDPISTICYWGNVDEFFINQIKCKQNFENKRNRIISDNITPTSLKISWFLSGGIDGFFSEDERFEEILSILPMENNIYARPMISTI